MTITQVGQKKARLAAGLLACIVFAGCSQTPAPESPTQTAVPQPAPRPKAASLDTARQDLEQIPPPAKSRYLSVRTIEGWSNPFLIVGKKNVTLRIYYPDVVASDGADASLPNPLLRPAGARKRELDLRLADLPEALAALPGSSWAYGRVVAIEEDPSTPRPDRVQMRRNVEAAIQMLNDLGIVVDEWPNNGVLR